MNRLLILLTASENNGFTFNLDMTKIIIALIPFIVSGIIYLLKFLFGIKSNANKQQLYLEILQKGYTPLYQIMIRNECSNIIMLRMVCDELLETAINNITYISNDNFSTIKNLSHSANDRNDFETINKQYISFKLKIEKEIDYLQNILFSFTDIEIGCDGPLSKAILWIANNIFRITVVLYFISFIIILLLSFLYPNIIEKLINYSQLIIKFAYISMFIYLVCLAIICYKRIRINIQLYKDNFKKQQREKKKCKQD